jgi:hypothetical protein
MITAWKGGLVGWHSWPCFAEENVKQGLRRLSLSILPVDAAVAIRTLVERKNNKKQVNKWMELEIHVQTDHGYKCERT